MRKQIYAHSELLKNRASTKLLFSGGSSLRGTVCDTRLPANQPRGLTLDFLIHPQNTPNRTPTSLRGPIILRIRSSRPPPQPDIPHTPHQKVAGLFAIRNLSDRLSRQLTACRFMPPPIHNRFYNGQKPRQCTQKDLLIFWVYTHYHSRNDHHAA